MACINRYVERLLDRISNGVLAEDRRSAMTEVQAVVTESFPVIMGVLKEERDDVEMVLGALETLVSALTSLDHVKGPKNEVQPALMNTDLLSLEAESISLLLSLLLYFLSSARETLAEFLFRLQEAILTIPRGITRLMDVLMDREVIRNEALLLLTYLTREAEEIQKIVVFEGAFEKIFSIIKEEGGSEGGVVVQGCLELLNNLSVVIHLIRAASVLSHILKDNMHCKERVVRIELEAPMPSLGVAEPLLHRMVRYLALASSMKNKDGKSGTAGFVQLVILKLLVTWLADCPTAVHCFLDSRPHLTYLLELVSNPSVTVCTRGLAAVLLGECVLYNKSSDSGKDAFTKPENWAYVIFFEV
ncbi:hypothetical protein Dsin_030947 [Dipteronia sinensis]|uniref:Vesicle tethering protein Uso1/P115-like head domain-containing protein n=1 Tax=Dipteronia sinensis TaxID=43782 RepID=A0AAE0DRM1_9ROSI|nr:hypothetical protein Dsin_030947 [Dipteronia sinensis]